MTYQIEESPAIDALEPEYLRGWYSAEKLWPKMTMEARNREAVIARSNGAFARGFRDFCLLERVRLDTDGKLV